MQYKIEPWAHQREAIARSTAPEAKNFALLWEPGTGKTAATIHILRHRFNQAKAVLKTIIFCPPVVVGNWRDEWMAHSSIDPSKVVLLRGSATRRVDLFLQHGYTHGLDEDPTSVGCVFVTNYESLIMPGLFKVMKAWKADILVFDEAHKLKNAATARFKHAELLANPRLLPGQSTKDVKKPAKIILTGTPVLKNGMDLWAQYKVLDGGRLLTDNFYKFKARYCVDLNAGMPRDKYFPKWVMRDWALDAIAGQVSQVTSIAKKKDCLDLPPFVTQTIRVALSEKQAVAYKDLEESLIAYLDAMPVTAPLALVKAGKLLQITSGFVVGDEGKVHTFVQTPKDAALAEQLEALVPAHKVIVWAVFKENYARIRATCERLGIGYTELHGEVSEKDRDENIKKFNTDPECHVLIGHPGSGGIGVNLVQASYAIFYSRTFSLEHSLQAEARNYRGGSNIHEKITRIDLVCENTIEEDVQKRLADKLEIGEKVLRDIAKGRQNGRYGS